jgi:uncharacterized membrane protein
MERLSPAPEPVRWTEIAVVVVLVGIGIAGRSYQIGYNFTGDELFSARLASQPFPEVIAQSLQDPPHPPLHNILLHFWTCAFGASETSTRLLSVVCSAGFLLAAYALFRSATVPRIALGLLALLAVSPYFVNYGQQARPYALIGLLSATNMLAFVRVLQVPESSRRLWLWVLSCVLLMYAQYLGGLLIVFEIAFALCKLRGNRWKVVLGGLGALALIGPWLIVSMSGALFQSADPLPHISWMRRPGPKNFVSFYHSAFGSIPGITSLWLLVPLVGAGLWYLYQVVRGRQPGLTESFLITVALGIPMVVYAVSTLGPKPVFEGRQMIAGLIAFVGTLGLVASSVKKGWDVFFLVLLTAWMVVALPGAFPQTSRPPWRQAANDLNAWYGAQTVVVLESYVADPLQFYRGGHVRLWDELKDNEKRRPFLLLCRPGRDSRPGLEKTRSQWRLIATWRWGRQNQPDPFFELDLFEVVPDAHEQPQ